jgi:prolycopene isomerase
MKVTWIQSNIDCFFIWFIFCLQVLCDRHFGGINYPLGGVGGIATSLAKGLVDQGSQILYKANVTSIITEQGKAVSEISDYEQGWHV